MVAASGFIVVLRCFCSCCLAMGFGDLNSPCWFGMVLRSFLVLHVVTSDFSYLLSVQHYMAKNFIKPNIVCSYASP